MHRDASPPISRIDHGNFRRGSHPQWHFYGVTLLLFAGASIETFPMLLQNVAGYLHENASADGVLG
jgi:hypothetical protein